MQIAQRQTYTTGRLWERSLSEYSLIFVLVENSNLGEIPYEGRANKAITVYYILYTVYYMLNLLTNKTNSSTL